MVRHYEASIVGEVFPLYDLSPKVIKRNYALDEAQASTQTARVCS